MRLAEALQTVKLYRRLRRGEEPLIRIEIRPKPRILRRETAARLCRFQIQLIRSPKTAKKACFSEHRQPIYFDLLSAIHPTGGCGQHGVLTSDAPDVDLGDHAE